MPRTLSSVAREAIFAAQTGEAFLVLLTLSHPDLADPIRVTSDSVNTVSGGNTFQRFPFTIGIPDEPEDVPPSARLEIDNVSREIIAAVQTVTGPPIAVRIEVVTASTTNTVECGPYDMILQDVSGNALTVGGTLTFENILNEPFPAGEFTPTDFPGCFR